MKPIEYKFLQYPRGANKDFIMEEVKITEPLNPYKDGTCRTIKAQYQQSSLANFSRRDGLGATGVMEINDIPKVIEVGRVKEGRHQQDFVQHEEGICRCICTGHHASTPHLLKTMVSEPISVAMRGRNPDNPSERGKSNGKYKQRLEMNESGVANTITSVQKDSMVAEPDEEHKDISYEEINETNTRKVLRLLRSKIGEENIQWAFGRFVSIFKEEILRQRVYEESICECRKYGTRLQSCTSLFEEDNVSTSRQRNGLRDMRSNQEYRCASQGFQLSEQFTREFNDIVSQLSYEDAQTKECLSYLWETCQGVQSMQQTLFALEKVWRPLSSTLEYIQPQKYRIRKLTCREAFRLMGVDDADIDKIQASGISNSQQYKCAGNSIVVEVLYHIFRKMFVETENENQQLTLF